jgi:hypothetical protein
MADDGSLDAEDADDENRTDIPLGLSKRCLVETRKLEVKRGIHNIKSTDFKIPWDEPRWCPKEDHPSPWSAHHAAKI